jgi:uncharacterized protein DUF4255
MSDYRAIGGVSLTLRKLLSDRMDPSAVLNANTKVDYSIAIPPGEGEDKAEGPRINLFLYRLTENAALKNQEIPGQGSNGAYGHPPLSLDLHYLLTAYGATSGGGDPPVVNEQVAHFLLGDAMRVLHDFAIVTEDLEAADGSQILHESLRKQHEQVKVSVEPLTLEDISKIWTALNRPYRLSAAFAVTVVQIESQLPRRFPMLVGQGPSAGPAITIIAGRRPSVDDVHAAGRPVAVARVGDVVVLSGSGFPTADLRVMAGGVDVTAEVQMAAPDRLTFSVPDHPALEPGPVVVLIQQLAPVGRPPTNRPAFTSNAVVFMLVPRIDQAAVAAPAGQPRQLTLNGKRLWTDGVPGQTLIADAVVEAAAYKMATSDQIALDVPDAVPAGPQVVRVRVNGAETIEPAVVTL